MATLYTTGPTNMANQIGREKNDDDHPQPLQTSESTGKARRKSFKGHRVSITSEVKAMRIQRQLSKGCKVVEGFVEQDSLEKIVIENEEMCASLERKDTKQELIDFLDGDVLSKECEIHEPIERPIIQIPEEATVPTGPISCSIELVGQSNYIWSGTSSIKVLLTTVSNIVLWKIVSNTKEVYVFGVPYNGDYKYATANGEGEKVRFSTATTSPSVMDLDLNEDLSDPRAFKLEYDSLSGQDRLVPSMYPTLGVTRGLYDRLYTELLDSNTDNWVIYT